MISQNQNKEREIKNEKTETMGNRIRGSNTSSLANTTEDTFSVGSTGEYCLSDYKVVYFSLMSSSFVITS